MTAPNSSDSMVNNSRGGCLSVFLIAVMIINPLTSLSYIVLAPRIAQALPYFPTWALPVLIGLGLANFIFAVAVWKWKKWGVYGFAAVSLVALAINLNLHVAGVFKYLGLLGPVVLIILVRPQWKRMS